MEILGANQRVDKIDAPGSVGFTKVLLCVSEHHCTNKKQNTFAECGKEAPSLSLMGQ
jgi:hypothetical protein